MSEADPAADYLRLAQATRAHTTRHLAYRQSAGGGARAARVAYRRATDEPDYSDTWYDFSQLLADAALMGLDLTEYEADVAGAFRHLERHWDARDGGYFARGGIRGDWVDGPDKYADDNALAGVALLAAADSAADPAVCQRYVARAVAIAEFVTRAVWDDVFGGGCWWNTRRGDSVEGKPAQSNGLAALLFLRLAIVTGEARWAGWAACALAWLDARLYDPAAGLYQYSVRYADLARRQGEVVERRYFNYDQAILIEALATLAANKLAGTSGLPTAAAALARARIVAGALEGAFWDAELGGPVLEAGVPQVFLVYAAWLTPALLALAAVDPDPRWVQLARRNADALHARLATATPGAYAHRSWREDGVVRVDPACHTGAQAWLQYAQARLAGWLSAD